MSKRDVKSVFGPLPGSGLGWLWHTADKVGLVLCWNAKMWQDEMSCCRKVYHSAVRPLGSTSLFSMRSEGNGASRRTEWSTETPAAEWNGGSRTVLTGITPKNHFACTHKHINCSDSNRQVLNWNNARSQWIQCFNQTPWYNSVPLEKTANIRLLVRKINLKSSAHDFLSPHGTYTNACWTYECMHTHSLVFPALIWKQSLSVLPSSPSAKRPSRQRTEKSFADLGLELTPLGTNGTFWSCFAWFGLFSKLSLS